MASTFNLTLTWSSLESAPSPSHTSESSFPAIASLKSSPPNAPPTTQLFTSIKLNTGNSYQNLVRTASTRTTRKMSMLMTQTAYMSLASPNTSLSTTAVTGASDVELAMSSCEEDTAPYALSMVVVRETPTPPNIVAFTAAASEGRPKLILRLLMFVNSACPICDT